MCCRCIAAQRYGGHKQGYLPKDGFQSATVSSTDIGGSYANLVYISQYNYGGSFKNTWIGLEYGYY